MNADVIQRIIAALGRVRERPRLYVGPDLHEIIPFLAGFHLMYGAIGIEGGYGLLYGEVMGERGWRFSPRGTWHTKP